MTIRANRRRRAREREARKAVYARAVREYLRPLVDAEPSDLLIADVRRRWGLPAYPPAVERALAGAAERQGPMVYRASEIVWSPGGGVPSGDGYTFVFDNGGDQAVYLTGAELVGLSITRDEPPA